MLRNITGTRTTYSYEAANQLKYGQTETGQTTYAYDAIVSLPFASSTGEQRGHSVPG
jgi:hypothetical protein